MRVHRQSVSWTPGEKREGRIREEIEVLEKRLSQIGPDGDCGYEKALIRFFEQQLGERRELLRTAGFQPLP